MANTFDVAMQLMHKHDPQTQEDGFAMLEPVAADFVLELIDAFETESDRGIRCWILELVGTTGRVEALPLLAQALQSHDELFQYWAERGLQTLDTQGARAALREFRNPT